MTTRPYLLAFAACVAGLVCSGPVLVLSAMGVPAGLWWGWWLALGAFAFLGTCALGVLDVHRALDVSEWNRQEAQRLTNLEREARLMAPTPVPADQEREAMALAIETFLLAGQKAGGFSLHRLTGCVGSDTWARLVAFYGSDAGRGLLRDAGGNVGTVLGRGWTFDLALQSLKLGTLPLPPGPVPDVRPLPDSATQRRAARKGSEPDPATPASRMVIER